MERKGQKFGTEETCVCGHPSYRHSFGEGTCTVISLRPLPMLPGQDAPHWHTEHCHCRVFTADAAKANISIDVPST